MSDSSKVYPGLPIDISCSSASSFARSSWTILRSYASITDWFDASTLRRFDDSIMRVVDLFFDSGELGLCDPRRVFRLTEASAPRILKHHSRKPAQGLRRFETLRDFRELTLQTFAIDGFAIAFPILCRAQAPGVFSPHLAFRPARRRDVPQSL
ncbi:MAG: hypothetical protein P3W94_006850 [Paracoccus sp. (in: a-proteobacteria)]|nr:hypothetical protein [Paracoccus sp. (in: a-proteobacteria)]